MKRLFLVRHGESASNAGLVTASHSEVHITEKGQEQAKHLANLWGDKPDLIVTSPFIRTQQTAVPFRERHPSVPHEEWTVQEFTQLAPGRYNGTTHTDRLPHVREYWERNDARYCDGAGAESFEVFSYRVERLFDRASVRFNEGLKEIAVFTHGTFMQAALYSRLIVGGLEDMAAFYQFSKGLPIPNTAVMSFNFVGDGRWTMGPMWTP